MVRITSRSWLALVIASAVNLLAQSSFGQDSFYKGKTIRLIAGAPPGGGFDAYSRAITRHIGKYIPGNPTLVVDNMPGAAGLVAAASGLVLRVHLVSRGLVSGLGVRGGFAALGSRAVVSMVTLVRATELD